MPTPTTVLVLTRLTKHHCIQWRTIAQITAIHAANGGGTLVYSPQDTAGNLKTDADTNNGAGTYTASKDVTVSDAGSVAELTAIKAAVGNNNTLTYTSVEDTASNLKTDADTNNGAGTTQLAKNITVLDGATIVQITAIDTANGNGTLAYSLQDTASNLKTDADTNNGAGTYTASKDVTVSDAASVAELTGIKAAVGNNNTLTYTSVEDTASNLKTDADTNNGAGTYTANKNITVSDAASVAQLNAIDTANGNGNLTYTAVTDTASNLKTDADTNGGDGTYVTAGISVTTDAATIAQITAVDAANGGTRISYTELSDTGSNLHTNTASYLAGSIDATITDAATN